MLLISLAYVLLVIFVTQTIQTNLSPLRTDTDNMIFRCLWYRRFQRYFLVKKSLFIHLFISAP